MSTHDAIQPDKNIRFFSCNSNGDQLFSVNSTPPLIDALEMAHCFLVTAESNLRDTADRLNDSTAWASVYMLEMACAIVAAAVSSSYGKGE
jgi:hypothetical protein